MNVISLNFNNTKKMYMVRISTSNLTTLKTLAHKAKWNNHKDYRKQIIKSSSIINRKQENAMYKVSVSAKSAI